MLNKLKTKFIFINMVLVGMVLIIVFTLICLNVHQSQMESINRSLIKGITGLYAPFSQTQSFEDELEHDFNSPGNGQAKTSFIAVVALSLSEDSSPENGYAILNRNSVNAELDDAVLESALDSAYRSGESEGYIGGLNLYYMMSPGDGCMNIAFADGSNLGKTMKNTVTSAAMIFVLSLIGLFFISLLLSTIALKPVKKTWSQQRQFVADASHELKTPLTVILANDNILLSHEDDTVRRQRQWIESTDTEARHMQKLVEDMLYLAKSDASRIPFEYSDTNLSELTWNTFLQFEPVAYEKGVDITADIAEDIHLTTDSTKARQLIHILLDNACKYADEGGSVRLSLQMLTSGIQIQVHNTGKPIPSEDLPHIFERFYRSDKARTIGEGYGLGLSIARSIAEQMGGSIAATSKESEGTTFTVSLPKTRRKNKRKFNRSLQI